MSKYTSVGWQRYLTLCLIGSAIALFVVAHVRITSTLIDDAYITYRYAANAAQGDGLVYNPGERVLGTTTPLYALLLAGGGRVVGVEHIPDVSRVVNGVSMLVAASSAAWLAINLSRSLLGGAVAIMLVLLSPYTLFASLAGMESPVFLALLSLGLVALVRRRWLLAAGWIGVLPLVRPEGVFVIGVLMPGMLWLYFRREAQPAVTRRDITGMLSVIALPNLLWLMSSTLYYGSPLPQSIVAKQAGIYPLSVGDSTFLVLFNMFKSLLTVDLFESVTFPVLAALPITVFVILIGAVWLAYRGVPFYSVSLIGVILVGFYATSRTNIFEHYLAHFELLLKFCIWAGLYDIATKLCRGDMGERLKPWLHTGIGVVLLFPAFYFYPLQSIQAGYAVADDGLIPQSVERQIAYRQLAQTIGPHLPAGTVIMLPEIGELGFFLPEMTILDTAGLVSPEATHYFPVPDALRPNKGVGVIPPQMVHDTLPNIVITFEIFGRKGMLDDPWFYEHYQPVIALGGDWLPWDSEDLFVFSRKDFAAGLVLQGITIPGFDLAS